MLSYEAFRRLGENLVKDINYCSNSGFEDIDIHSCLRKLQVFPKQSIDELGRERFHMLDLKNSYLGNFVDGMDIYAANPLKKGLDCCSDDFISFHYTDEKSMIRLATIINRHERLFELEVETERPSFKTILDEFMLMEDVEKDMSEIAI